jgi:hypothetical protein
MGVVATEGDTGCTDERNTEQGRSGISTACFTLLLCLYGRLPLRLALVRVREPNNGRVLQGPLG